MTADDDDDGVWSWPRAVTAIAGWLAAVLILFACMGWMPWQDG